MVVNPVTGQQMKRALEVAGLADRAERLKAAPDPTAMAEMLYTELAARLKHKPTAYWMTVFSEADVPVSEVLTIERHLTDPQVTHSQLYRTTKVPGEGAVRRLRYPALFDGQAVAPSEPTAGRPTNL